MKWGGVSRGVENLFCFLGNRLHAPVVVATNPVSIDPFSVKADGWRVIVYPPRVGNYPFLVNVYPATVNADPFGVNHHLPRVND